MAVLSTDVLVIGAGGAGMYAAIAAGRLVIGAQDGRLYVLG